MTKLVGVTALLLIVLAGAACGQQPSAEPRRDVLILRASGQLEGSLQGCSAQACALGARSFPRSEVFMIGLAVSASEIPPPVADPTQDTVLLRDGTVVKGQLASIDARQVVTEQGSHPRANVAWVFLALASPGPRGGSPPQRAPRNAQPEEQPEKPTPPVTYMWQGRIEVENNYNGLRGTHRWTAQYQVKFLEEQTAERRSYRDSFKEYSIVPLEFQYTIDARQDWDRGGVRTNSAGEIIDGPLRMHGQATGIISADRLRMTRYHEFLSGDIGAIETRADSASTNQRAFASDAEYNEFWNNHQASPGWYHLNISFDFDNDGELRAYYNGINRSGERPVIGDPDSDFVSWVPSHMPGGINVIGRLDTPDQTDVRGEFSLRVRGDDDPEHVKVKWVFVRKRTQ